VAAAAPGTRFSASTAIRWVALSGDAGSVVPGPLGGDRRSARIKAHAPLILTLIEQRPDVTPAECSALAFSASA
jgi:hypothetical protein